MSNWVDVHLDVLAASPDEINAKKRERNNVDDSHNGLREVPALRLRTRRL